MDNDALRQDILTPLRLRPKILLECFLQHNRN
jgi:hypothetical protein